MNVTPIAIQDSELLLDLMDADLLRPMFALSFPFSTTDLLWQELGAPCQRALSPYAHSGRLLLAPSSVEEHRAALALAQQHPGLSLAECSVCCLAQANNWPMLAVCASLLRRRYSPPRPLYDLAWLLGQLVAQALVTKAGIVAAIKRLLAVNPRLQPCCAGLYHA